MGDLRPDFFVHATNARDGGGVDLAKADDVKDVALDTDQVDGVTSHDGEDIIDNGRGDQSSRGRWACMRRWR